VSGNSATTYIAQAMKVSINSHPIAGNEDSFFTNVEIRHITINLVSTVDSVSRCNLVGVYIY